MAVFRNKKKQTNYTVIDNDILQNENLSWKARGILTYLLSLPANWDLHLNEAVKHATDGEHSFRSGVEELKEAGYIHYRKEKDNKGHFQHIYNVFENPHVENPDMDNPNMDNSKLQNNNQQSNKEKSNNINKPSEKSDTESDEFSLTKKDNGRYDYPEEYERLYSLYPYQRGNKKAGWRKWAATRRKNVSQDDLLEAVKNYAAKCKKDGTEEKWVMHIKKFFGPDEYWKEYLGGNESGEEFQANNQSEEEKLGAEVDELFNRD